MSVRLLIVANKILPENDYRLAYVRHSRLCDEVRFALPDKPASLAERAYVHAGFAEGLGLADIGHFVALLWLLWRERRELSLVHFYSTKLVLFGPLVARLAGVPSLVTISGYGRVFNSSALRHRLLRPIYWSLARLSASCSRAVLFQNHGDRELFVRRWPKLASRCRHIGSGVSTPVRAGKDYRAPRLGVALVARLLESKGIDEFLAVAEALRGGPFELTLIGPPSRGEDALLQRVLEAHAKGVVRYLGELPSAATERELAAAHVLLFTSHGEGMSRVMLEAGFAGACPVAYDIAANRDLLAPGRGVLLPLHDVAGAVAALRRLERDRDELERNALAYQAFVREHFSSESFAARLDGILREVLSLGAAKEQHVA